MIEEYHITHLGHSATTMRLLKKYGEAVLRSVMIPLIESAGKHWRADRRRYLDVGNEICRKLGVPNDKPLRGDRNIRKLSTALTGCQSEAIHPMGRLGMDVDVFDDGGNSIRGQVGYLVCKKPAPSMTRGFWNDFKRYHETYWERFPGVWYHGDWAYVDRDEFWFLHGRADDVIKVAGRRIGPD